MIIAIDVGNSNIVMGCIEDGQVLFSERLATNVSRTELEYVVELRAMLELYEIDKERVTGAIISSVVPPVNNCLRESISKFFGVSPIFVGPGVKTGLNILMDNPAQVGSDIIANAVAGLNIYGAPLVIVDVGTATTIGVINEKGSYIGGLIAPGVRVSIESLESSASQLPRISLEVPRRVIGRNTIESMRSGIIYSQASAIDGLVDRVWNELTYSTKVVATGGMASTIVPVCRHDIIVDDRLTIKGLGLIYNRNHD